MNKKKLQIYFSLQWNEPLFFFDDNLLYFCTYRFSGGDDEYGIENSELGEYDEEEEDDEEYDEDEEEEEEEEEGEVEFDENGEIIEKPKVPKTKLKKKQRPVS